MWVLISLASLIVIIILLLCVPFDFVVHVNTESRPLLKMNLTWFFGLFKKRIEKSKKPPKKTKESVQATKSKRPADIQLFLKILKIKGLVTQVTRLLKGSVSRIRIKELAVDLTICPDDAADTGILFAYTTPLRIFEDTLYPFKVNINPVFEADTPFTGELRGVVRLQPVRLINPVTKFIFSGPVMRLIYVFITNKWKK